MAEEKKRFDVIVIGGGPGGYPAAIRAAQAGKSVALIEARELGGTCLNRGCIPSKTLIANAEVFKRVQEAEEFGVIVGEGISFDYNRMAQRKDRIVDGIRQSLGGLVAANAITLFRGYGKFISQKEIKVIGEDNVVLQADQIIIATGSEPRVMDAFPFDYKRIHDSTSFLNLTQLPKKLVVIGGGVIGCEFASLHAILGVDVTILELMPRIIPMEAEAVSAALTRAFEKKGIKIKTKMAVTGIETTEQGIRVLIDNEAPIEADSALVSVGRKLNTDNIGLEKAGVAVNANGIIPVDDRMQTNVSGIYAIGDIASKWWLAHVATHQGLVAASNAVGVPAHMHYNAIPSIIYTDPEVGTVGLSVEAAQAAGYDVTTGAFPFQALGKSQAGFHTDGFAQVVVDKKTGQVLGAQVVGYEASTLIAEMALAIANELTVECVTETIHAHPTLSEAWLEAALIASETPLHLPPKKKKAKASSSS